MKNSAEKKSKKELLQKWLQSVNGSIIVSVAVATIGAILFLPTAGIISTFPLTLLLSAMTAFAVRQFYYLPIAYFAMTYLFSNVWAQPTALLNIYGGYSLRMALRAAAISLIGCLISAVIKNAGKIIKSKAVTCTAVVLLIGIALVWGGCCNGTPWDAICANNEINGYVGSHFDMQGVSKSNIYYVAETGGYYSDFNIVGKEYASTLSNIDGVITENVTDMFTAAISEEGRIQLTALLRETFPDGNFQVSCKYSGVYSKELSLNDPKSVSNFLKYTVDIYDMSNAKSFVNQAESFYTAVMKSGFGCKDLTINGGIRHKMYYTISGNPYVPRSNNAERLGLYSKIVMPTGSIDAARISD